MKTAVIHWGIGYELGGMEWCARSWAGMLADAGFEPRTIGIRTRGLRSFAVPVPGRFLGIPFVNLHQRPGKTAWEVRFARLAAHLIGDADGVLTFGTRQAGPVSLRRPTVVRFINPWRLDAKGLEAASGVFSKCSSVLVETRAAANELTSRAPAIAERVRVVPQGILPRRRTARAGASAARILSVGRLDDPRKGMTDVVEAMALLTRKRPDATCVLAGHGAVHHLEEAIRKHGLERNVELLRQEVHTSWREALDRAFRDADLFVLATRAETFGIVFIEAMAEGLPIVTVRDPHSSQAAVIDEVVGSRGRVGSLGDHQAMAENLFAFLEDDESYRRASAAGLQAVQTTYHRDTVAASLIEAMRAATS